MTKKNYVFTFHGWKKTESLFDDGKTYWQCEELIGIYPNHNFSIYDADVYDKETHDKAVMVTQDMIHGETTSFSAKYGDDIQSKEQV